ncbi:hypothetical protein CSKR_200034 [Clonorchis sinensis]|uniref:Uncharacterized protein n=1 Tax=Clonorchis sinensis TaxID=79923 RepID=A0A8T1LZ26_CLOSI|nr:hypothetical protein CSKR_200034 [Clonorchis sinensis]
MRRKQESPKVLLDGILKELGMIGAELTVPVAKKVLEVYNKAIDEIVKEAVFGKFRSSTFPDESIEKFIQTLKNIEKQLQPGAKPDEPTLQFIRGLELDQLKVYTIMPQSQEMWQGLLQALDVDELTTYDICKGIESVLDDVDIPPFGCSQIPKFPKAGEEKSVKLYIAECKNTEAKVSVDIMTKIHKALNVEASLPVNVTSPTVRTDGAVRSATALQATSARHPSPIPQAA